MSLKIIWSPASKEEYADILGHVEDNFGIDAALKLLDKRMLLLMAWLFSPPCFPPPNKEKMSEKP